MLLLKLVIFPVFPEDGESFEFVPSEALQSQTTLYLLFFSETRFIHGHYQSKPHQLQNGDIVQLGETIICSKNTRINCIRVEIEIIEKKKLDLPPHEWIIEPKITVYGPNAGKMKYITKLIMAPYIFGKFKDKPVGGLATFSCNSCHSKHKAGIYVTARKVAETSDPVFPEDGESFEFVPSEALQSQTTLYLLFFSETRFIHGHYQSIGPRTENSSSGEPPEKARNDSETTVTLSDLSGRSDFEAISDINLPWARLISNSKCWNNVNITDDKWTFGKKAFEEALNEKYIPPRVLKGISNYPFSIERTFNEEGNVVVLLIDLSKSGTCIGDTRVVQNVSNLIFNDDYIGITGPATKIHSN